MEEEQSSQQMLLVGYLQWKEKKKERKNKRKRKGITQARIHTLYRNQLEVDYKFKCTTQNYKTYREICKRNESENWSLTCY